MSFTWNSGLTFVSAPLLKEIQDRIDFVDNNRTNACGTHFATNNATNRTSVVSCPAQQSVTGATNGATTVNTYTNITSNGCPSENTYTTVNTYTMTCSVTNSSNCGANHVTYKGTDNSAYVSGVNTSHDSQYNICPSNFTSVHAYNMEQ